MTMSEKVSSLSLVIDTSRRRDPLLPGLSDCGSSNDNLRSPKTTGSSTTLLWSATVSTTPATGLTANSAYENFDTRTPPAYKSDPEWLITKIDEYLADLNLTVACRSAKSTRHSLKIDVSPEGLSSVERALPSSPDALLLSYKAVQSPLLTSGNARSVSALSSPAEFDVDFASPLFYQCFSRPDGCRVSDDAAPFPYSPCRESVSLEAGGFGSSFINRRGDSTYRRPFLLDETSETKPQQIVFSSGGGLPHTQNSAVVDGSDVPSIRLETSVESDFGAFEAHSFGRQAALKSSPPSTASSTTSCESGEHGNSSFQNEQAPRIPTNAQPASALPENKIVEATCTASDKLGASREKRTISPATPTCNPKASPYLHSSSPTESLQVFKRSTASSRRFLTRSSSAGDLSRLEVQSGPSSCLEAKTGVNGLETARQVPRIIDRAATPGGSSPIRQGERAGISPRGSPEAKVLTSLPTSTQIIEGVRKVNKLKRLLGEEVGSHISTACSITQHVWASSPPRSHTTLDPPCPPIHTDPLRWVDMMKPLPRLPGPPLRSLQRSNTANTVPGAQIGRRVLLDPSKPREKKCCKESSGTGRPSTARDARCRCPNCVEVRNASQRLLTSALAGTSLRLDSKVSSVRPSTASSHHSRSLSRSRSFLDVDV